MKCPPYHRCGAKLFVRLTHTVLCLGVPASLLSKDTILAHALLHGENLVVGILYVALLAFSLSMYYAACFVDPGYLPVVKKRPVKLTATSSTEAAESDEEGSTMLKFQTSEGDFKYRQCDFCEIQQPMRTKHCEDCGKCVRKYDHHCPWLEACIGERNHKFFWLFLLATSALTPWTLYMTWNGIEYQPQWGDWIKTNILLMINILIEVAGGFIVVGLLSFHTFLMLRGLTTWEAASRERITYLKYLDENYNPFNEGLCKNTFYFLCSFHSRKWEGVYTKHAQINSSVA